MLRYADFRLDASSLTTLPDGSIVVTGQLTHAGIFSYRNPDGTERRELRPADEVFREQSLKSFANSTVTMNHPYTPDGQRLVSPSSWRSATVGHVGSDVRQDGEYAVASLFIKEERAISQIKSGEIKFVSLGYQLDYDPTPGKTPQGERFDGVQRNIRGNHVALLPAGVEPRGGAGCQLRLDSNEDEILSAPVPSVDLQDALNQIEVLKGELSKARTDAAEVPALKAQATADAKKIAELTEASAPARLDSAVAERAEVVTLAKAQGIATDGVATLNLRRAIVAKRTPALAARVDSMDSAALDNVFAVYAAQPHPTLAAAQAAADPAAAPSAERTDAAGDKPIAKVSDLHANFTKTVHEQWKQPAPFKKVS